MCALCGAPDNEVGQCFFNHWLSLDFRIGDWVGLEGGILKSKDITLPTKVRLVKAMVFPVVMCRCESWTIKKAEHQRIDAFQLWCWRRPLRVHWTARRSSQSILKEINSEFIRRTDAEAEAPIRWPPDAKILLIVKDPNTEKY